MQAQKFTFGVTAGTNLSNFGVSQVDSFPDTHAQLGYNFGLFGRIGNAIFLQPEVVYICNRSNFLFSHNGQTSNNNFQLGGLCLNLMAGIKWASVRLMGGGFVYTGLNTNTLQSVQLDENAPKAFGFQIGAGLNVARRWSFDARFMRTFDRLPYHIDAFSRLQSVSGTMNTLYLSLSYAILKI